MIAPAVDELALVTSVQAACRLLGRPRGSHYRAKALRPVRARVPRPAPVNKLTTAERKQVFDVLTCEPFADTAVAQGDPPR